MQSQYRLVYEAVLEAYTSRDCRTDVTSLGKVLTSEVDPSKPNHYIDTQFKVRSVLDVLLKSPMDFILRPLFHLVYDCGIVEAK